MGLNLRQDHKYTPEEVQFLKDRERWDEIAENERLNLPKKAHEPKETKDDVLHLDQDIYDKVVKLNLVELQQELRALHVVPKGDERELRTTLAEMLQDRRDAGQEPSEPEEKEEPKKASAKKATQK